jgi:UDP-N-acetylmuramate dehydrogenase
MMIEENKSLAPFTTFGIGGPARWFAAAASEDEVVEAVDWARKRGVPLFVLGGGSNLLVSDAGFDGLVLHIALRGVSVAEVGIYQVAAGEVWDDFVERTVRAGDAGLECLAGIPGTVGGTPVQNVGAYGQEVATTIVAVRAFDLQAYEFVELSNAECGFSYRKSRFNTVDRGRFIVTRVDYQLKAGGSASIQYADLKKVFAEGSAPSLVEVAAAVRRIRQLKGMLLVDGDADCRSAGSFFKNPVVSEEHYGRIAATSAAQPPKFSAEPGKVKIPAAWLIEQSGFQKGYALGNAGISSKHTLALINRDKATAAEIAALRDAVIASVETKFRIRLEMEPVLLGF